LKRSLLNSLACLVGALGLVASSGCGSNGLLVPSQDVPRGATAVYNPLAPSLPAPRGVDSVKLLRGLPLGARTVVATTASDELDDAVQATLRLSGGGDGLTISLARPLTDVALYVRYNGAAEHLKGSSAAPAGSVSLVHEVEPGLLAVAFSATTPAGLKPGRLITLSFAPGASAVVRSTSTITGNARAAVTDLAIADNGDATATLQWSERNPGDYDLNSEVNSGDLAKIGQNYRKVFDNTDPDFAKLDVIDGDGNGEINGQGDLTVIGQNYKSTITGYNLYRTTLATPTEDPDPAESGRWTKVDNATDASGPSAPREFNGQNFRLVYTFVDTCGGGDFGWYVRPTGAGTGASLEEGTRGEAATATIGNGAPPDAGLSFEIQPPAGGVVSAGDDIYIAVKVTGAVDLFSANVRVEYDSTLLQFVEVVPSYNDGTDHPNILTPPLFVGADNVGTATAPYKLLGFNATQTLGTPAVTNDGALGYMHFTAVGNGLNAAAVRFPQSTNFIYLWGVQYGVPVLTPSLGSPLQVSVVP
jgi:hypothetical protein